MQNNFDANGMPLEEEVVDIELIEEEVQEEVFVEPSVDEKFNLIIKACELLTEIETRGNILKEFQPQHIKLSTYKYDGQLIHSEIRLVFRDGKHDEKVAKPCNWSGMGYTVGEALTCNLWCLQFETEERIAKLQKLLIELQAAAPMKSSSE